MWNRKHTDSRSNCDADTRGPDPDGHGNADANSDYYANRNPNAHAD
jgi:hypothetical protein